MKLVIIKKSLVLKGTKETTFLYNEMLIFSSWQFWEFEMCFHRSKIDVSEYCHVFELENMIRPFNQSNGKKVYVCRSGGIGDILALSSLCKYIYQKTGNRVRFITQEKYRQVLDWFEIPVHFHDPKQSIADYTVEFRVKRKLNNFAQINFEGKIESGINRNWFEIFFDGIDIDFKEFGRPHLNELAGESVVKANSILLCLQSTAWIRSMSLEDVCESLYTTKDIYVHEHTLTAQDLKYATLKGIKIIPKSDLKQYFLDLSAADQVISVDTGAIHFREGLKKSCIGLYGAFTSECRTKYYQYTKSFDIRSNCPYQPCFQHSKKPNTPCKLPIKQIENYAPCLHSSFNKELRSQLSKIFKENL